jgi:hypothetical protein
VRIEALGFAPILAHRSGVYLSRTHVKKEKSQQENDLGRVRPNTLPNGFIRVKQIWSEMHQYRQESFALAILGIVLAGQAVMQRVAEVLHERLSKPCKVTSYERQLQRLIDNEKLAVTLIWERFLQHTLPFWDKRRALLVLDCTPYNETFTIVFVGILVQKRLLPLAWEIMPQSEKWEQSQWHIVDRLFAKACQLFACSTRDTSGRSRFNIFTIDSPMRAVSVALYPTNAE